MEDVEGRQQLASEGDAFTTATAGFPAVSPTEMVRVEDGGEFELRITPVQIDTVSAIAEAVIDYTREDFAESGIRYDVILDRALAPRGALVIVGGEGGKGKLHGGFTRGTVRAPLMSMFSGQTMKGFVAKEVLRTPHQPTSSLT